MKICLYYPLACIRPGDANSFIQSLTRMYHHTATESPYYLCGVKTSLTATLAEVSYKFGFVCIFIHMQWKISGSSVFSYFFSITQRHICIEQYDANATGD